MLGMIRNTGICVQLAINAALSVIQICLDFTAGLLKSYRLGPDLTCMIPQEQCCPRSGPAPQT